MSAKGVMADGADLFWSGNHSKETRCRMTWDKMNGRSEKVGRQCLDAAQEREGRRVQGEAFIQREC